MTKRFNNYGVVTIILTAMLLAGCGLANKKRSQSSPEIKQAEMSPGKGDAFLFDTKITRNGKKNSVRLDIYRSGDTLSVFARGYLGKGVMKALVVPDSIRVYFPTENEFYSGKIEKVINSECSENFAFEKMIVELFMKTPPEIEQSYTGFYTSIVKEKPKERHYQMVSKSCQETIDIEYDLKDNRFIPKKIEYENEDGSFKFSAKRRTQKLYIDIPSEKFLIKIPETALKIIP